MAVSLRQILAGPVLTRTIQTLATGVANPFPDSFFTIGRNVIADEAATRRVAASQRTARQTPYGSRARSVGMVGASDVQVKLIHTFEDHKFSPHTMLGLLDDSNQLNQMMAINEVSRQSLEFKRLFQNLRYAALTSVLCVGAVHFDANGNLLKDATGATLIADSGVPAANKGNLGGIIDADWDQANTDILGQMIALRKAARQRTGLPLKHAFYGEDVPGMLMTNTVIKDFVMRNPSLNAQVVNGSEIPDGLLGLTWHPAYDGSFEDKDGTRQQIVTPSTVSFCPEPSSAWYEFLTGSYPVPRQTGVKLEDAVSAAQAFEIVFGMFGFGDICMNPPSFTEYVGDTFLPNLSNPSAIYIADVKAA